MTSDAWLNNIDVLFEVLNLVGKRVMVRSLTIVLPVLFLVAPVLMGQTLQQITINGTYQTSTGTITLNQPGNPAGDSVVFINPCDSTTTPTSHDGQNCDWPPTNEIDFPMPALSFGVPAPYNTAGYTVEWTVDEQYTDDHGVKNTYHETSPALSGDQSWKISWENESVGGGATVTADVYEQCNPPVEVAKGSLSFFVFGVNQNQAQTDMEESVVNATILGNAAWFLPNLIALESSGHQFGEASGHPNFGKPDGNGVMQVDRTKWPDDYILQNAYWNFVDNMQYGAQILKDAQLPAYTFWNDQVAQMQQWAQQYNGGQYVYPTSTSCMNSTFSYPKSGQYDYSDAEWIVGYNGTCHGYFVAWNEPGYLDQWHINYPDSASCPNTTHPEANWNYVGRVCGAVPY